MSLRHITEAPKPEDFTPLAEHQEQTPATFFGSKPVLYAQQSGLTVSAEKEKLLSNPATSHFSLQSIDPEEDSLISDIELWVTSENLIIFQTSPTPSGVSIPFPSIGLHATMKWKLEVEALYMNVSLNDAETVNDDDDIQILEITILPPKWDSEPETACIGEIYAAMNTCADLHPDPDDSDAEEAFDETAPGATGWITADNMEEFMDEEGNLKLPVFGESAEGEELGPGAGTVRNRDEEDDNANGVNGENGDGETKWQRTG